MHISSYQDARAYLESFIYPGKKKRTKSGIVSLQRMNRLLDYLNNPQERFRSIQISGTAGKGSTGYLLSKILSQAGYKTGLTISPHLQKLNERIQIMNEPISDEDYIRLVTTVIPFIERMKHDTNGIPSYLEILMAMAFVWFAENNIDIAVVEVGLEGKYDSSNVLIPILSVITNIHLDHTELLGDTVESIAHEAVSIIKSERQVTIVGSVQPSVRQIIEERISTTNSSVRFFGEDFTVEKVSSDSEKNIFHYSGYETLRNLHLPMTGSYQIENSALAIDASLQLRSFGFIVSEEIIRTALAHAFFPGRFEMLRYREKDIILDGAHNPIKMDSFVSSLKEYYPDRKKTFILSFKKGKAITEMLKAILPVADLIIITEFHSTLDKEKNAAITIKTLRDMIRTETGSTKIRMVESVQEAIEQASNTASSELLIITGSLYLVGEARSYLASSGVSLR